ncbi:AAA family ATPase [Endozoicomonas sp. GU-1]|uniref:AAA family ATPase n=1 Tax=Endozoicomonas sp. GU-1 TaxID=3009078 RepID=UPI0022B3AEAB|nr:AAA family ATPase [Endozoicomonas sp. GU-1]WBA79839.1 AAA family ATPase [Endozoicomonas sp. GU-1]WBA87414.1 AAA family ATPase [Endozoicomonas sp. GU-1]
MNKIEDDDITQDSNNSEFQLKKIDLTQQRNYYKGSSKEIIPGLDTGTFSLFSGKTGTGKTKAAIHVALIVCGMKQDFGFTISSSDKHTAVVIGCEDTARQLHEQTLTIKENNQITDNEWLNIAERVDIYSATDKEIDITSIQWEKELIKTLHGKTIAVIDGVSNISLLDESNESLKIIATKIRKIASITGCAIILIHHNKKPSKESQEFDPIHTVRGGSSLVAAARSTFLFLDYDDNKQMFNNHGGKEGQIAHIMPQINNGEKRLEPIFLDRLQAKNHEEGYSFRLAAKEQTKTSKGCSRGKRKKIK